MGVGIPNPTTSQTGRPAVGQKDPIQIAAKRFEFDENVNKAHLKTHWRAGK